MIFMITTRNMKQALPFMLIISLLSFVACNSEDKVGKDITLINGISETGKNQPKKTPSTYMKTKESIS